MRMGANGMPMPEKKQEKKPEALQEILEVNPNTVEEEDLSSDWEAEEEETDEEL
jgi:hypothetical protein